MGVFGGIVKANQYLNKNIIRITIESTRKVFFVLADVIRSITILIIVGMII